MAMMNNCDHSLLVWIDLEMSGLDLAIHTIVEIAIAITDFQLQNYIEGSDIVIHHDQDVLDKMNDWSREQHTKSGLIQLIRESQITLYEAETTVIEFLKRHCVSGTGILAGNSVFVDRWFIEKYMPRLNVILHPSIVDCSTLKELTLRWQPIRYTKRPHKQMMHRARDDIRESINELNHYQQHNFHLGWHTVRHPPYVAAPILSNPRTHLVWLKTDSDQLNQIYVIITDGNLNILNDIYIDMNDKCNQYSFLVGFLHKNILVNRSSPICGRRVHIDRARLERVAPEFISCCHYRSIDVDVLDVLCQRWARRVYESRPMISGVDSNNLKRELHGSIQLLQYYRANVFKSDLFCPRETIICPMALHKLSKSKSFHVAYCGCTAASLLLNDQIIRDAIDYIRQVKTKRDYVKTTITVSKDGVKIIYDDQQQFSSHVPSSMIAGSATGKPSLQDTIGVVYVSPLTGYHYPAFVHVYRCDSSRTAQKLLSRLRAYILIENHRLRLTQLEQDLLGANLLNLEYFNASKSQSINSTATNSENRQEKKVDPVKSITEEFQKKIDSHQPILFPPKDYDTLHVAHGNIQRAQAWKSTEPTIVGYSPIDPDDGRTRRHIHTTDKHKTNGVIENNGRSRLVTHQSDATTDPVETVNIAFDFLKDETGSIFADNDGNIENIEIQQQNKPAVYRFRPPQIPAMTKKLFTRNNNYQLTTDVPQSNSSSRNDLDVYYNHQIQNGHRAPSETRLHYDQPPGMHLNSRYENRLSNRSGVPISTNPLWTDPSSNMTGSQPNLLSHQSPVDSKPLHRHLSPSMEGRLSSVPLYASYPDSKPTVISQLQGKRPVPVSNQAQRKQKTQSQYLDTNEFILRASNGQPLRNGQHPNREASKDYRPRSVNANGTMLDVYY